jgi:hypothetical protein
VSGSSVLTRSPPRVSLGWARGWYRPPAPSHISYGLMVTDAVPPIPLPDRLRAETPRVTKYKPDQRPPLETLTRLRKQHSGHVDSLFYVIPRSNHRLTLHTALVVLGSRTSTPPAALFNPTLNRCLHDRPPSHIIDNLPLIS